MSDVIPQKIDSDEILIRYITLGHIKRKKTITKTNLEEKNLFLDTRGGVSMQRYPYCSEQECKYHATKLVEPNNYVGYAIFKFAQFEELVTSYQASRKGFEASIYSTPLNEHNQLIVSTKETRKSWKGNPAHSDLYYLNPAPNYDETPNTAIRSFSRKLFKKCKILFDEAPTDKNKFPCSFSRAID